MAKKKQEIKCCLHTPALPVLAPSCSSVFPHGRQDEEEEGRGADLEERGKWEGIREVGGRSPPPLALLPVTSATLPEFHKSLRRSRK